MISGTSLDPAARELYSVLTVSIERIRAAARKLRARSNALRTIAERLREAGFDLEARRLRIEGAEIRDQAFDLEQLQRSMSSRLTDNVTTFAATFEDTQVVRVNDEGPRGPEKISGGNPCGPNDDAER